MANFADKREGQKWAITTQFESKLKCTVFCDGFKPKLTGSYTLWFRKDGIHFFDLESRFVMGPGYDNTWSVSHGYSFSSFNQFSFLKQSVDWLDTNGLKNMPANFGYNIDDDKLPRSSGKIRMVQLSGLRQGTDWVVDRK